MELTLPWFKGGYSMSSQSTCAHNKEPAPPDTDWWSLFRSPGQKGKVGSRLKKSQSSRVCLAVLYYWFPVLPKAPEFYLDGVLSPGDNEMLKYWPPRQVQENGLSGMLGSWRLRCCAGPTGHWSCLLPRVEDVVSLMLSPGQIQESWMLVSSPTHARMQIVSVSSSWDGVSPRLKRQWPHKSWATSQLWQVPICTECCWQLCTVKESRTEEKPHQDRLHLLLLGVTTSLPLRLYLG